MKCNLYGDNAPMDALCQMVKFCGFLLVSHFLVGLFRVVALDAVVERPKGIYHIWGGAMRTEHTKAQILLCLQFYWA